MPLTDDALQQTVAELSTRPGHEKVRTLVHKLLTDALGARSEQITYEHRLPEVKGRIDALLGRTVIEIKSDLRREEADARAQLARYLPEREAATGQRYVGLATDGARLVAYEMRDGVLTTLTEHEAHAVDARELTAWLEGIVAVQDRLPADALNITNELGRQSAAFARSLGLLAKAWDAVSTEPEAALKRQLWARHLGIVYGKAIETDELWLQHTYLVTVAKAIAAGAMGFANPSAEDLLSGQPFRQSGVYGAVEEDFFGWVLETPGGSGIVDRLAAHAHRFDLASVDVDLLKVLYESLIDPKQRHDLGEYYTPDWLARKVVRRALRRPADDSALDPSCGSGSFLFHALRLKRGALAEASTPISEIAARCCGTVTGFDIHPVAVIFARVTYLLALGPALAMRGGDISVPVYLGDALQWNVKRDAVEQDLVVEVPPDSKDGKKGAPLLRFQLELCADPALFDRVVEEMHDASEAGRKPDAFGRALLGYGVPVDHIETLRETYATYDKLRRAGRDHVWGYVARNLSRPVAVSDGARVDVVIGNPPWLSYRFMSAPMQARFRETSKRLGVWVSADEARLVTHTDLSGLFFARAAELYAKRPTAIEPGGRIAMVLPLAILTRGQYRSFRTGAWSGVTVNFDEAWTLDNQDIGPLFRVPTCVLFAERTLALARRVPSRVTAFAGRLPFKDAPEELADSHIRLFDGPTPSEVSFTAGSPYRERFRQGATLVPRMLCLVERADMGRLGTSRSAPLVRSRRSPLEKKPWIDLDALQGPVEANFLMSVYLGESIAPFRLIRPFEGIIPVLPDGTMMNAQQSGDRGYRKLGNWLRRSEEIWNASSAGSRSLKERWNFHNGLTSQFPISPMRVMFSASGSLPAAVLVRDTVGVVEHKLYWGSVRSEEEAYYLISILNSEATHARISHMQSRGEQGERDFDKLMFTLPIPLYDARDPLHEALAAEGLVAEQIAAAVPLAENTRFQRARALIRVALREDGVAGRIDGLVVDLLGSMRQNPLSQAPPKIPERHRDKLMAQAKITSARLRGDPVDRSLLDEWEEAQAGNSGETWQ